ncbi:beta-lactamase-like protein [Talaromyces proteolyticus]|uniref:Beta-lactamase-like protein n=1 Tax=Talaromyces proteolyticus TaxID=1131652 RepID=A0AAD4KRL9_9EURO|nr:beta-lactamase-like protein [Talaromyces proteolyticus]KAH8694997.1 beta-lactamase-like protein [Talaromyces proteolyticus]
MVSNTQEGREKHSYNAFSDYLSAQRGLIPELPPVTHVTSRVIRILGGNPGEMQLQGTNTYLLGTGNSRILVDTGQGFKSWIESLIQYLNSKNLDISFVLLTHWHQDHTGGVRDLIFHKPHLASRIYKSNPDRGQIPIADGQIFHVEGATLKAILAPGHAFDHTCFVLEEEQALFTGDNILGHGFTVIEDLGAYLSSLRYMESQRCLEGYPGHGTVIENLACKIGQYIRREELRINQVYSLLVKKNVSQQGSLRKSSFTNRELVTLLYGEVSDSLFEIALGPCINNCLWKLAEDGKIGFEIRGCNRVWYAHSSVFLGN